MTQSVPTPRNGRMVAGLGLAALVPGLVLGSLLYQTGATLVPAGQGAPSAVRAVLDPALLATLFAFLPALCFAILLAAVGKRFGWRRWWQFAAYGAVAGAVSVLLFWTWGLSAHPLAVIMQERLGLLSLTTPGILGLAGGSGAFAALVLWTVLYADFEAAQVTAVLTLAGLLATTGMVGAPPQMASGLWGAGHSADIEIGTGSYTIPYRYIAEIQYDEDDGRTEFVLLRLLLPDFRPYPAPNLRTSDGNGTWRRAFDPKQELTVMLRGDRLAHYERTRNLLKRGRWKRLSDARPANLLRFASSLRSRRQVPEEVYVADDANYLTPDGRPLIFQCGGPAPHISRRVIERSRNCEADYLMPDGVSVHYAVDRAKLVHWRAIDSRLRTLLASFQK